MSEWRKKLTSSIARVMKPNTKPTQASVPLVFKN